VCYPAEEHLANHIVLPALHGQSLPGVKARAQLGPGVRSSSG